MSDTMVMAADAAFRPLCVTHRYGDQEVVSYHSISYEHFLLFKDVAKRLRKQWRLAAAYYRWARKSPRNRRSHPRTYDDQGRPNGRDLSVTHFLNEPTVCAQAVAIEPGAYQPPVRDHKLPLGCYWFNNEQGRMLIRFKYPEFEAEYTAARRPKDRPELVKPCKYSMAELRALQAALPAVEA